jgi:hypothetical protein
VRDDDSAVAGALGREIGVVASGIWVIYGDAVEYAVLGGAFISNTSGGKPLDKAEDINAAEAAGLFPS